MKIFISSSLKDKKIADRIVCDLKAKGFNVLDSKNIVVGENIINSITKLINTADGFIAIVSRDSLRSNFINEEIIMALGSSSRNHRKRFIPILIEKNIEIPTYLSYTKYIDLTDMANYDVCIASIIKALKYKSKAVKTHLFDDYTQTFRAIHEQEKTKMTVERIELITRLRLSTHIMTIILALIAMVSMVASFNTIINKLVLLIILLLIATINITILLFKERKDK